MKTYEDECIGCPTERGCMGSSCQNRNVLHCYCDNCGDETTLYYFDDEELCLNCVAERLDIVEGSED